MDSSDGAGGCLLGTCHVSRGALDSLSCSVALGLLTPLRRRAGCLNVPALGTRPACCTRSSASRCARLLGWLRAAADGLVALALRRVVDSHGCGRQLKHAQHTVIATHARHDALVSSEVGRPSCFGSDRLHGASGQQRWAPRRALRP